MIDYSFVRASQQYKALKKVTLKRDRYQCKLCGAKKTTLDLHHIIRVYDEIKNLDLFNLSLADKFKKIRKETGVLNCRNVVILCRQCHSNLITGMEMYWAPLMRYLLVKRRDKEYIKKELELLAIQLPKDVALSKDFIKIKKYLT